SIQSTRSQSYLLDRRHFWNLIDPNLIQIQHSTHKIVSISEASIRNDLLFDDADGIDSLPNQAIFDAIQLMGYEGI
ncbi:hypothetical protein Tco_0341915, partial [Tanacetum coccineum]